MKLSGFSLIEILIAVSIITLLLGIGIASYLSFNDRQKLKAAGLNLKNTLREAQSKAFTGEKDCSVCNCERSSQPDPTLDYSLVGWRVDFFGNNYTVKGTCQDLNDPPTFYTFSQSSVNLPSDVTFHSPPD